MPLSSDDPSLEAQRDAVRHQLAHIGYFRPGTLAPRYVKCGKPTCRCAPEGAPGHGPYWLLTSEVNGQARCRSVPAAAVERTQQQIAEYHRFRQLVKTLIEVNSRLCDTEMDEAKQVKAVKKKRLRPGSRPKSPPRWKT